MLALQAALLDAKSTGAIAVSGIGTLSWQDVMVLVDILLGAVWGSTTMDEQAFILSECADVCSDRACLSAHDTRYGALRVLGWLLSGWPDSLGARIARVMIGRRLPDEGNHLLYHLPGESVGRQLKEENLITTATRKSLCIAFQKAGGIDPRLLMPGSLLAPLESSAAELLCSPFLCSRKLSPILGTGNTF